MKYIYYKGYAILVTFQGFYQIRIDGQSVQFDNLRECKRQINYWMK
jgi:hypothetical protein